ncbi:hypothetical protein [Constrictibacter sp. MBR-5]|uniref:hypothetical protein n=1 Tax=Constrictibacter sp. MBR-5 TaxID=3156467 RepID=UPI0033977A15
MLILLLSPALAAEPYDRALYRHWIDADGDCQDTREEVLIAESLVVVQLDQPGCKVLVGLWVCPYTGSVVTDRRQIDIDHMVPLAEAHASGADIWDEERRQAYANDLDKPDSLVAVLAGANRSKGPDPIRRSTASSVGGASTCGVKRRSKLTPYRLAILTP